MHNYQYNNQTEKRKMQGEKGEKFQETKEKFGETTQRFVGKKEEG